MKRTRLNREERDGKETMDLGGSCFKNKMITFMKVLVLTLFLLFSNLGIAQQLNLHAGYSRVNGSLGVEYRGEFFAIGGGWVYDTFGIGVSVYTEKFTDKPFYYVTLGRTFSESSNDTYFLFGIIKDFEDFYLKGGVGFTERTNSNITGEVLLGIPLWKR